MSSLQESVQFWLVLRVSGDRVACFYHSRDTHVLLGGEDVDAVPAGSLGADLVSPLGPLADGAMYVSSSEISRLGFTFSDLVFCDEMGQVFFGQGRVSSPLIFRSSL
jgi:hypothetical protein